MDEEVFNQLVVEAVESLPEEFAELLENIEIVVEPGPSPMHRRRVGLKPWQRLYGLYQGIPLTKRNRAYNLVPPDVITIFREPLVHDFPDPDKLRNQVRRTVLHEIAHHFGISDERLRELGAY